ncbi:hypothetical protein PV10_00193 [Exophiala mesophila]|uniref:Cytochrome b-c1 complex subunit 8 n=1 Tax=Exophiala mesophila TaxID=212818 RepID=A0A0D1Y6H1_EXOME|nr:uncharacterized protein PV10_00193 [Exophiala mesophila]KIV96311.1 hypothetical protein PV10_00193 [Exophiala mesophila]
MEYNENLPKGLGRRPVYCWGHKAIPKQTGIVTYALSPNRQRPLANAFYNAFFNTFRRSRAQFWYVVPPFVAAWWLLEWAEHEAHFASSKEGRRQAQERAGEST